MRWLVIFLVLLAACGGSPSTPSAVSTATPTPTPVPTPTTWTLTGQILRSTTQQPIAGTRLLDVTTDSAGLFSASGSGSSLNQRVKITASGYLERDTQISASRENPIIDLIPESAAGMFRQIGRNAFEGGNEPIRRWTSAPQFDITQDGSLSPEDIRRVTVGILAATNQMSRLETWGLQ